MSVPSNQELPQSIEELRAARLRFFGRLIPSLGRTLVFVISFSIVSFLTIQFALFGFGQISSYLNGGIKGCDKHVLGTLGKHLLPNQCRQEFSEFEAGLANFSLRSRAAMLSFTRSSSSGCVGVFKFSGTVCLQTLPYARVGDTSNFVGPVCIWSDVFLTNGGLHYKCCYKMPSATISEPAIFLHVPYGKNFQHILQDGLTQLALVRKQLNWREASDTSVLMYVDGEGGVDSWAHYLAIELFGFKKILVLQDNQSYCAQDSIVPLFAPDFIYGFFAEPAIQFVAQMGADKFGINRNDSSADKSCAFKIIYVSRPDAGKPSNGRVIRNQSDVVGVLRQWSQYLGLMLHTSTCVFEFSGELSLTKRQTHLLFHEASVIVGVHGGGISHIVFSSLETFIFEILVGGENARSYASLAAGHKNYHNLTLPGYTNPDEGVIEIPTDLLQGFLSHYSQEVLEAYNSRTIMKSPP
jgi:capsular polysaccharide biosynthesis protein